MLEKQAAETLNRAAKKAIMKQEIQARREIIKHNAVTPFSECVNCCSGWREKWGDHRFSLSPPFLLEFPTLRFLNLIALEIGAAGGVCGLTSSLAPLL